ncbi:hypothetical protein BDV37DRAFT_242151, partial [Aspergillus pseudonomiae]
MYARYTYLFQLLLYISGIYASILPCWIFGCSLSRLEDPERYKNGFYRGCNRDVQYISI